MAFKAYCRFAQGLLNSSDERRERRGSNPGAQIPVGLEVLGLGSRRRHLSLGGEAQTRDIDNRTDVQGTCQREYT